MLLPCAALRMPTFSCDFGFDFWIVNIRIAKWKMLLQNERLDSEAERIYIVISIER